MFASMNKNLVLISAIGLFLEDFGNPLSNLFFSISQCLHEAMKNFKHGGVVAEIVVVRIIIFVIKRKCQQEQ
jgi:hypothetical protein